MGFLFGLGHQVARRDRQKTAPVSAERLLDEQARAHIERLFPLGSLQIALDAEATELRLRARFAGAELDASARNEVQRGDPLSHPRRVVVARRQLDDAMPQSDLPCA